MCAGKICVMPGPMYMTMYIYSTSAYTTLSDVQKRVYGMLRRRTYISPIGEKYLKLGIRMTRLSHMIYNRTYVGFNLAVKAQYKYLEPVFKWRQEPAFQSRIWSHIM